MAASPPRAAVAFPRGGAYAVMLALTVTCATLVPAQDATEKATMPDRGTWVRLDCLTSGCHAKLSAKPVVHAPVSQGACDACHEVDDADAHSFASVGEGADGCLECHVALDELLEETETNRSSHFPVTQGDCLSCHDPHASNLPALLSASYRPQRYARFEESQFELCFQCHDAELVTESTTDEATRFRNGEVNLHHVHVGVDGKGRNCQTCHVAHVSGQSALVREAVMFKEWPMPLRYLPTKTGGSCGPGCHTATTYDREEAVPRGPGATPPK